MKSNDEELVKKQWPVNGEIVFEDVVMKYRDSMEPSIRNLSFKV